MCTYNKVKLSEKDTYQKRIYKEIQTALKSCNIWYLSVHYFYLQFHSLKK